MLAAGVRANDAMSDTARIVEGTMAHLVALPQRGDEWVALSEMARFEGAPFVFAQARAGLRNALHQHLQQPQSRGRGSALSSGLATT